MYSTAVSCFLQLTLTPWHSGCALCAVLCSPVALALLYNPHHDTTVPSLRLLRCTAGGCGVCKKRTRTRMRHMPQSQLPLLGAAGVGASFALLPVLAEGFKLPQVRAIMCVRCIPRNRNLGRRERARSCQHAATSNVRRNGGTQTGKIKQSRESKQAGLLLLLLLLLLLSVDLPRPTAATRCAPSDARP